MQLIFILILSLFLFNTSDSYATCGGVAPTKAKYDTNKQLYSSALSNVDIDDLELVPLDENDETEWNDAPEKQKKDGVIKKLSKTKTQDNLQIKWLESLRPKDFVLLQEIVELKGEKLDLYGKDLETRYKENPDVFSTAIPYGLFLIDTGEVEKAGLLFERAISDFKSNQVPVVYKAWTDILKGNYIQAKDALHPVVMEKVNAGITGIGAGIWLPQHIDAVVGLYLLKDHLPEKDRVEISKIVDDVTKHFTKNPKFVSILITKDLNNGKLQEASEKFSNILQRYPENPTILTLLGVSQLLTGYLDEALVLFDQVNGIYPYSSTSYLMKARVLSLTGEKEEADTLIQKAFQLDSQLKKATKNKLLLAKTYKFDRGSNKSKPVKKANKS